MDFRFVENFAAEVVRQFGTRDVLTIAEKARIRVVCESWHPVTAGEFEHKTKTIRVNRRVFENNDDGITFEKIIAHELGHFFAADLNFNRSAEEEFAHEFARVLTEDDRKN